MAKDLLLEIGLEEIPARFVEGAMNQLKEKVTEWLQNQRIPFGEATAYATPRRLSVLVQTVSEKQEDLDEEAKGPSKKIALDQEGNWTKAAEGFARGQGVTVNDLYFKEVNGNEYVFVRKRSAGTETKKLLPQLEQVITGMTFPKNMRWGSFDLRYVRPIRWLVALFGEEIIPFEIAGVQTGNLSRGHRFLGNEVTIPAPEFYQEMLLKEFVIVDVEQRKNLIVEQIRRLSADKGWVIPIDEELLEEVTYIVEYPTVLYGSFDQEFLKIPQEVLVTSMREHQRYFPVEDKEGNLLPHFVTVRNGDDRNLEGVAKGNEKVLRARLADARFFYEEDQKVSISSRLSKLENVVFHEELGTISDKVQRIREISGEICELLKLDEDKVEKVDRIAEICKFDLVTNMVYEFPELQGIMGEKYARIAGEDEEVAKGIFEHYLPRFAGDQLPSTVTGGLVSISDKLDTIVGCFGIGIIPTGSQDPYGLRRQAAGVVSILLDQDLPVTLDQLFTITLNTFHKRQLLKRKVEEVRKDLYDFFTLRLKNTLQERNTRYDVIDAVLQVDISQVKRVVKKADILMEQLKEESFKGTVEAFTRVFNLAGKGEEEEINTDLFLEEAERELYKAFMASAEKVHEADKEEDMDAYYAALQVLKPSIDQFFEQVMVMVDDEQVRNNRLALLKKLDRLIKSFADFNKIVFA
ncbi:glycine--tRNA ligase subunit beta [Microaerobacter geothermalis]|uniref:glycine--tRNA ligase subunit beta n=1 Tax=Microaerobacter geothermalis TaxID=674972 RepID=UPI001F3C94E8|nr:glycine--tRNA ligase subunit beta [Microaerobacter geothermalis]MCF6092815.1 glycine--tRNA ligase subunit beta [Microaerobacter geothermalis]